MPTWLIVAGRPSGNALSAGTTTRNAICGFLEAAAADVTSEILVRNSYTLADLYVRVTANATAAASTVASRQNAAAGAQSVTIGAGATGVFQDTTNSDSLVDGDLINSQIVVGAGGSLTLSLIAYTLTSSSDAPIIAVGRPVGITQGAGSSVFLTICGYITSDLEPHVGYTFRVAATLANLRCFILSNNLNGAAAFRLRVNAGNGSQLLTIGAGATGAFEDTTNTDAIAVGDEVNYVLDATGAATGGIGRTLAHITSSVTGRQTSMGHPGSANINFGQTLYGVVEGPTQAFLTATEANAQVDAQASFTARNLFVFVPANSINGASVFTDRINGGPGNLTVTVGASATGAFEDTSNTTSYVAGDLIAQELVTGGSSGFLRVNLWGFEQEPVAAAAAPSWAPPAARALMAFWAR